MRTPSRLLLASAAVATAATAAEACGYYDASLLAPDPSAAAGGTGGTGGTGGAGGTPIGGGSGTSGSSGHSGQGGAGGTAGTGGLAGKAGAGGTAGTSAAGGGAGGGSGAANCTHASPPPPPVPAVTGGTTEFVATLRTVDFHEASGFKDIGYDLDKTCTCEGEGGSCLPRMGASMTQSCDGAEGRDNALGGIIATASLLGVSSSTATAKIEVGGPTVVLRIRNYNGTENDSDVVVAWYASAAFDSVVTGAEPKWDGTDAWPILPSCIGTTGTKPDLDKPLFLDDSAYVVNGVLVASLKGNAPFGVNAQFNLELTGCFVTATIEPSAGSFRLSTGTIVGRWPVQSLISQLGSFAVFNTPLCTDSAAYPQVKTLICTAADILSTLGTPTDTCDAMSVALDFTSEASKLGIAAPPPPKKPNPCVKNNDPAMDTCNLGAGAK